jgi:hypothetical protein
MIESVLFHTLHLDPTSLVMFYTMAAARERQGRLIEHLVQHLRITLPAKESDTNEYVWNVALSLLYLVPRLQSFEMAPRRTLTCHMKTLAHLAAPTLRSLNIIIEFDASLTILWTLRQFPCLESLKMTCRRTETWNMEELPFISLPQLREFGWTWREACTDQPVAWYLANMKMAHGGAVTLSIPQLSPFDATVLLAWLRTHRAERLALDLREDTLLALRQLLSDIASLKFATPPPIELFDSGRWPRSLALVVDYHDPRTVYDFLDRLLLLASTSPADAPALNGLRSIGIDTALDGPEFRWAHVPDGEHERWMHRQLAGRLMQYALEFDRHGIWLLDSEGAGIAAAIVPPASVASDEAGPAPRGQLRGWMRKLVRA